MTTSLEVAAQMDTGGASVPDLLFLRAALDFAAQDVILRAIKKVARRCSEYSGGSALPYGAEANPACDMNPESEDERCDNCAARFANAPAYRSAMKKRQQAKTRMMRWYSKVSQ